jgi:hypothetical protein
MLHATDSLFETFYSRVSFNREESAAIPIRVGVEMNRGQDVVLSSSQSLLLDSVQKKESRLPKQCHSDKE